MNPSAAVQTNLLGQQLGQFVKNPKNLFNFNGRMAVETVICELVSGGRKSLLLLIFNEFAPILLDEIGYVARK